MKAQTQIKVPDRLIDIYVPKDSWGFDLEAQIGKGDNVDVVRFNVDPGQVEDALHLQLIQQSGEPFDPDWDLNDLKYEEQVLLFLIYGPIDAVRNAMS